MDVGPSFASMLPAASPPPSPSPPLSKASSPLFNPCSSCTCPFPSRHPSHCPRLRRADSPPSFPSMAASNDGAALSPSYSPLSRTSPSSAIDFLMLCQRLKTTKRTGWVNHGLKETESISDHMHRMAVMAIIGADIPGIDRDKCVKMAVIHDIAEAIVGDITPTCGVPKEEKSKRERAAIDEMCNLLGGGFAAEEVKSLWLEYENNASLEASIVKDFDKVEMILQALEYETAQGKVLNDFYESTAGKFQTEVGKSWAAEIIARRKNMMNARKQ